MSAVAAVPEVLVIAGSDSSAGAGVLRDAATIAACGLHAQVAITAVTAQSASRGVECVQVLPPDVIAAQIRAALRSGRVAAVKTGMLATADTVLAVARSLADFDGPVVCDPVLAASSGSALLDGPGCEALLHRLLPRVTVLTPNLPEARRLCDFLGLEHDGSAGVCARNLAALGPAAVLVKGGHDDGTMCRDVLATRMGIQQAFESPRLTGTRRGTGCCHASALAASLARGRGLAEACLDAQAQVRALWIVAG